MTYGKENTSRHGDWTRQQHDADSALDRPMSRRAALAVLAGLVMTVPTGAILAMPAPAYATELTDVLNQANDLRNQISTQQDEYYKAVAELEQVNKDIDDANKTLDGYRGELSQIVNNEYTGKDAESAASVVSGDSTVDSVVSAMTYYGKMRSDRQTAIKGVADAKRQKEEAQAQLKSRQDEAQRQLDSLNSKLEELQPTIQSLSSQLASQMASAGKSEQASMTLNFLSNVSGMTDKQVKVVRQAYRQGYAGGSLCEAWVTDVLQNAGVRSYGYGSAYEDYAHEYISSDKSTIPAGALLFGSGTSVPYSHVGIALTSSHTKDGSDVLVLDNEGSRRVAVTLPEWLKWQTAVSSHNGRSGWFGWGGNYLKG